MERIASAAAMSHAVAVETEMPSEEDPEGIADRARAPAAAVVPQAWEGEAVEEAVSAAEADEGRSHRTKNVGARR